MQFPIDIKMYITHDIRVLYTNTTSMQVYVFYINENVKMPLDLKNKNKLTTQHNTTIDQDYFQFLDASQQKYIYLKN